MKKHIFLIFSFLVFTISCTNHNDDNSIVNKQPEGLLFNFTEADYGDDEELSRTTVEQSTQAETVDLEDCEAEVSIEREPVSEIPKTATRAIVNKHYTIRAYQGGVKKGEISGTFKGTIFEPDATSRKNLFLSPGVYDFVAFNDDVTPAGENLTVNEDKVQTARMATFTATVAAQGQQQINFEMKPVGARLHIRFLCQKHIPENITATLEANAPNTIPVSLSYDPVAKTYTGTNGTITPKSSNSPASTEPKFSASNYGQTFAYTSTSDYHYFLPNTSGNNLKLTFSAGTVFWKPLTGNIPQLNATLSMKPGKSYVVKIKLKPKFTYLFSDGTTGSYKETTYGGAPAATAKKAIAVVLGQGRAMALAEVGGHHRIWGPLFWTTTTMSTDFTTNINDMKGYEYSWTTTYNTAGVQKIKATDSSKFPAFGVVGTYNPGVSTSWLQQPAHRWYLPAYGELKLLYLTAGFGEEALLIGTPSASQFWAFNASWYGNLASLAFTQVGGYVTFNNYHFSSSETHRLLFAELMIYTSYIYFSGDGSKRNYGYRYTMRPFIRYE